ncbi:hypothetical protein EVJ58_g7287 [Rhodofomes roseus]|uniref:Uncharacterized protein n=1 Tax=Rhodofomes roseus TaxID=34475 RepID=A0A4Y9Y4F2_9APHY|nr:hypothetical protein EVJ58_g7287 [Rhodofomes roseus]
MHARCSICQDTLGDANTPMTTLCGHLYCAETDDLVAALADIEAPDLRNLLANVVGLLGDIRAQKIADAARLSELESQRDTLQTMARRLTERLREHQRARETEREAATEELTRLREEWTARIAALQEELQGTTAQLNTERAKVEQAKVVMTELDADAKKWQTQASRYKKKVRRFVRAVVIIVSFS